jgi:hypothetical protein
MTARTRSQLVYMVGPGDGPVPDEAPLHVRLTGEGWHSGGLSLGPHRELGFAIKLGLDPEGGLEPLGLHVEPRPEGRRLTPEDLRDIRLDDLVAEIEEVAHANPDSELSRQLLRTDGGGS